MLSVGGELGYMQITAGADGNESSANILDRYVPVAAGYRINPSLAI